MSTLAKVSEQLEQIEAIADRLDLDDVERSTSTSAIVSNLETIENDGTDLETVQEQTNNIATNLRLIQEDETDLDALAEQTDRVVANLTRIAELLEDNDVAEVVRLMGERQ